MKKLLTILILALLSYLTISCDPLIRKPFQTFEKTHNKNYSIRYSAYEVNCFIICDAEYVLESFSGRKLIGKRLLTITDADPIKFSSDRLIIKNKNLAYFSLFTKFIVTSNGGKTWLIWDSHDHQQIIKNTKIGWIEDVEINETGTGKMKFENRDGNFNEEFFLETNDFGKTWQKS